MRKRIAGLFAVAASGLLAGNLLAEGTDFKFSFGPGKGAAGFTQVSADTMYTPERGYGFEANSNLPSPGVAPMAAVAPTIQGLERGGQSLVASDKMFIFSVAVPEGNYRVTLTLGDPQEESTTTVKAEARRLMIENLKLAKGATVTRSFLVNVRRPEVSPGVMVKLDPREPGSFTWDDKLSLQFSDVRPALISMEIHKVEDAVTVYLCGDSTVTDQPREPFGSWGQMLPRWFNDKVAVANFAESGETLKAFKLEKRWDKVMSLVKKGDYVFMQFGNNDMQRTGHNAMWPADDHDEDWANVFSDADTDYQAILKDWAAQVKAKGPTPVIIAPYTRQANGTPSPNTVTPPNGLRNYPAAAEKAANDSNTLFLNLTAISTEVLTTLRPTNGARAYVDGQHTSSYGAYINARSVTFGIKQLKLELAQYLTDDSVFDPKNPVPLPGDFKVPLEPGGRGAGRGPRGGAAATATGPATTRGN